jgi:cytoskeleton protein RodZ
MDSASAVPERTQAAYITPGAASDSAQVVPEDSADTSPHEADSASAVSEKSSSATDEKAGQSTTETSPANSGILRMSFNQPCWVSLYDATGKRLMAGIAKPGTTRRFKGRPPYRIVLGFAPGVKMTFNGQPVNLKPYINADTTARLTVGHS